MMDYLNLRMMKLKIMVMNLNVFYLVLRKLIQVLTQILKHKNNKFQKLLTNPMTVKILKSMKISTQMMMKR